MTKRICVTGASGRAGRVTVRELLAHGYQVVATDRVMPAEDLGVRPLLADLTDYGQATEVLQGVGRGGAPGQHPGPGDPTRRPPTFHQNMAMNFNVFHGCGPGQAGAGGVGVQRDRAPAPVRRATPPTPRSTRTHYPVPDQHPRAVQGGQRDRGRARLRVVPDSVHRPCGFSNILGPADYPAVPRSTGQTRACAGGTCGATSMSVTRPWPAGWRWRHRPRVRPA